MILCFAVNFIENAHLVNAGNDSCAHSDYNHNAKYNILKHDKNLHKQNVRNINFKTT